MHPRGGILSNAMDPDQHEPTTEESRVIPLDYATPAEPRSSQWVCLLVSVAWMMLALYLLSLAVSEGWELLCEVLFPSQSLLSAIGVEIRYGPGHVLMWIALFGQWPAYGLILTWANWNQNRHRFKRVAFAVAGFHLAAVLLAIASW